MANYSAWLREGAHCASWTSLVLLVTVWSLTFLFNIVLAQFLLKWWGHDLYNSKGLCEARCYVKPYVILSI